MPLLSLNPGERGVVIDLRGGPNFRSRLYAMGLAPGAIVRVLENYPRGPVIVEAGGTRLALGKGMAAKVLVRKL
ncbi:iron(II) transport protein A [Thermococcus sp. AM4]|nr:iron(II) transport protein A [Thermococcus sp. AM4]